MRLPAGEYVIIVSHDESDSILEDYKKRWKIEVLFQALKSRGFNLEATHLKDEERLKTLFSVLTIAFCWSYHVGAWRHVVKPIKIWQRTTPIKVWVNAILTGSLRACSPQDKCKLP
jgi:hypothetical protein